MRPHDVVRSIRKGRTTVTSKKNTRTHILSPTAVLYNEPEFLLRTELRNPARYMTILKAIATGHTTPNAISGATSIDSGPLSKYLQTLRRLRLIDREVPVTASTKQSKRSRYGLLIWFLLLRLGDRYRFDEVHLHLHFPLFIVYIHYLYFSDILRPKYNFDIFKIEIADNHVSTELKFGWFSVVENCLF
ncbi:AAA+ superfamily ATPase fused to HTH and RecB nuclease domains [Halapricum desulfuricans]|uniref:AAA+ superfamily ATPase fused to HTH and RecB nuclease domains n=1 Tax=Halapricum desulfuricans TaxID=2841257 RepID=A0A897NFY6_9EURY|nr:AAA+ superfamily ATPase fused to HTH and RecB nuclease domains [Halapricum desulfuricans]